MVSSDVTATASSAQGAHQGQDSLFVSSCFAIMRLMRECLRGSMNFIVFELQQSGLLLRFRWVSVNG